MLYFELIVWATFGLIVGSFVNVCNDRLSIQFSNKEKRLSLLISPDTPFYIKKHIQDFSLNIFKPTRSFCFSCGHKLSWFEIIPVFSYFLCRGHCRKCNFSIGIKTIWTEIIHGGFYLFSRWFLENNFNSFALCLIFSIIWILANLLYFKKINKSPLFTL